MSTRIGLSGLLTLALLSGGNSASAAEPDLLAGYERFVGGAWEAEGDAKIRVVYEWGLNKKLLKIKSYFLGKEKPELLYESSVYVHPGRKELVFQSVSAQGGLFDGVMTRRENVFTSEFTSYSGDKTTKYRQTIEFKDDDHVIWKLYSKEGDGWKPLLDVKEHRVKDPAGK